MRSDRNAAAYQPVVIMGIVIDVADWNFKMELVSQIVIAVFGAVAVALLAQKNSKWRRWGYIVGLLSEPAWLYTSIHNRQWGIVLLCFWYGSFYLVGIYNHWVKK